MEDPDFEDLVTGLHLVSQTLIERGFGSYLLCAIFRFENEKPVYWVYNFKQGHVLSLCSRSGQDAGQCS